MGEEDEKSGTDFVDTAAFSLHSRLRNPQHERAGRTGAGLYGGEGRKYSGRGEGYFAGTQRGKVSDDISERGLSLYYGGVRSAKLRRLQHCSGRADAGRRGYLLLDTASG